MGERVIVTGYIKNYIYTSDESLYKVAVVITTSDEEVIIVGSFPRLEEGLNYDFIGEFKEHPKYGRQLAIESYAKASSYTKEGLISYLSSDKFYGIGEKLAEKIIDTLGLDCIDKILKNKDCLDEVKGITLPKKEALYEILSENYLEEQTFIRLYGYGLTSKMIKKLYDYYGTNAPNIIEENPYRLITDVEGFGFKKSDNLAINLGFPLDDLRRIRAAIVYTLNYVCYQQGFTYLTNEQLINSTKNLLNNNPAILDSKYIEALDGLIKDDKIISEDNRYFDAYLYKCEVEIAKKLTRINEAKSKYSKEECEKSLSYIEELIDIKYTPLQKEAIINALSNKLSIITGGPGTGKSTILDGILKTYANLNKLSVGCDELDYKVTLVAPTGRAAKRMTEATKFKATTIHKALGYNYTGEFAHDESNPLSCSLLVIDEASMLDVSIAYSLFKALSNKCQIILVGDSNQLPSVGPGNVLSDLMASNIFKTTRLSQIMRQASGSDIITLSHMILNESIDYKIFSNHKDVFFYDTEAKTTINMIYKLLDSFIKNGGDLQGGIQILAPMYAGVAGIDAINEAIQSRYNPERDSFIKRDLKLFKKGDKVLQLKNDSELDIMNGDIGRIMDIVKSDSKDILLIDFDGRVIKYPASNIDNLTLAYAISIHKAQGSQFDNVIMPILPSYSIMLRKKIIYTGITRAKKKVVILGKLESIERSLHQGEYNRQTSLYERVSNDSINVNRIYDKDIPFDTFGEYDMEGITPYTFMDK